MNIAELQKRTAGELQKMLGQERAKLQQLKFDLPSGKVKNVSEIRKVRRGIAQILTFLKQKQ